MGHIFYTDLGNKGYRDLNGNPQAGYGLLNKNPFINLLPDIYWSGIEYGSNPTYSWFLFDFGYQDNCDQDHSHYSLAVHEGDVANMSVPEGESSIWFFIL
jgi:hypothetical protein